MLKIISIVALPVFVLSIVVLAIRGSLFSPKPVVIACQVCGLAVMLWARTVFPKGSFRVMAQPAAAQVIQSGPYRFIRHPMYAGAMLILWASIAGHFSLLHAGIGIVATAAVLGKICFEERLLRASFPGYEAYARSTKTLIPFVL